MTLFRRINDILTANLNDLVDRFEDPEKMLRQAVRELDDALAVSTSAAARSIATQKLLSKEIDSQRDLAALWQRRAAAAVAAGDDDQARRALSRRREHERLAGPLEEQRAAAEKTATRLRRQIDAIKVKRADAGRMLVAQAARQCAVRAYQNLHAFSCGAASNAIFHRFERLRQRVELAEAEAEALLELAAEEENDPLTVCGEEDLAAIEAELSRLKQEQGR